MEHSQIRFGELSIKGFRRLRDVRLSLRPLSVMIGANGTGKTSVLDVFSLLASSAQGRLSSSISDLSGLANVLTYDQAEELGLEITMEVPGYEPLEYSLWLPMLNERWACGSGITLDSIPTLRSMTSKPGYFRSGVTFRIWQAIRKARLLARQKP